MNESIVQAGRRLLSGALTAVERARLVDASRPVAYRLPRRVRRRLKHALTRVQTAAGRPPLLVPPQELEARYREALRGLAQRHGARALGDYLEFGVYVGTSLGCMHRALEAHGLTRVRLFGFDSFQGLPEAATHDDEGLWGEPGRWHADYGTTVANLTSQGIDWGRTTLVAGWYEDTLTDDLRRRHGITRASVIMIDCDLYSSSRAALDFCAPLIDCEAVVFFDDWDDVGDRNMGEKRAFREFLAAHPRLAAHDLGGYGDTGRIFRVTVAG
jgi:O-methyltransferase